MCVLCVCVCVQYVSCLTDDAAVMPAASEPPSQIGGNGLWWAEDPALLWEFNSITALVKNELKLSLKPPPMFQRLSRAAKTHEWRRFGCHTQASVSSAATCVCESAISHPTPSFCCFNLQCVCSPTLCAPSEPSFCRREGIQTTAGYWGHAGV